jgi:hypothetical protein
MDPVLPAPFQDRMDRDEPSFIENADLIGELMHFDDASRPVGNAVVVAADREQAVMADPAFELEQCVEGKGREGLQFGLLGSEGFRDNPLGGAVVPDVSDRGQPVIELGIEIVEVAEGAAQEEVLADVAEWSFDLALSLRPIGAVSPRQKAIMLSERDQRRWRQRPACDNAIASADPDA